MEFTIPLNKFEKEKRVIELHLEGKTLKEIAQIVHMSFRDISKIIKVYDKKIDLQQNKKEPQANNQSSKVKKPSLSSRAFKLFSEGKEPIEAAITLDIKYEKVSKYWYQFLKLEKKFDCYEFYEVCQYDLPSLLIINNFIKRNNVSGTNIVNVLRTANDVFNLNQMISNLKGEIEELKQTKYNNLLNQNTNILPLPPLGLPEQYYRYW